MVPWLIMDGPWHVPWLISVGYTMVNSGWCHDTFHGWYPWVAPWLTVAGAMVRPMARIVARSMAGIRGLHHVNHNWGHD